MLGLLLQSSGLPAQAADARSPSDGTSMAGAFSSKQSRDHFAEQGHSAAEEQSRIETAFQQLFHGDSSSQTVYYEAVGPMVDEAANMIVFVPGADGNQYTDRRITFQLSTSWGALGGRTKIARSGERPQR